MSISLKQVLELVGKLDDSSGEDVPRERFRHFLHENLTEVGQIRDFVQECLRGSGDQYAKALQDLIVHVGSLLDFQVNFGRYSAAHGQIGYDGYWESNAGSQGFHIIVEVKTTETYPIKTATLVGYIDELISEKRIPGWDSALGLYVVGRSDPEVRQLENAIIAERRTHQLRVISADSLLSLAEMVNEYDVSHEDVLAILRPSGPKIDAVIDIMTRLAAAQTEEILEEGNMQETPAADMTTPNYWLTPVKSDEEMTAEEVITTLVGQEKVYAFGERTPGRRDLKPGDLIAFYATEKGVVAHAQVTSVPDRKPHPRVRHPERYPWTFRLVTPRLYVSTPVVIDGVLRNQLDAFRGRDSNKSWAWFVQATRKVTKHDFDLLTRTDQEPR